MNDERLRVPIAYLARFSLDDLRYLYFATDMLRLSSERLAKWLEDAVIYEQARRLSIDTADPLEADLPCVSLAGWTNSELAGALMGTLIEMIAAENHPEPLEFLRTLHKCCCVWAVVRLEDSVK